VVLRRPIESALVAAVGVDDAPRRWATDPQCLGEGPQSGLRCLLGVDGVADHLAVEGVEDDRGEQPSLAGADLGEVGEPQRVLDIGMEVPLDQVADLRTSGRRGRSGPGLDLAPAGTDAVDPHQPGDRVPSDPHVGVEQLPVDPR